MHTKAVYRAAQALNEVGMVALRFNFRGVGASTGSYDEGMGEQDDALAAIDWLQEHYPGLPLIAGGFSFGSMVGLKVGSAEERVVGLLGIGLPIEGISDYDYGFLRHADKPVLVVQGEDDQFGAGRVVAEALAPLGPHVTLVRIPGADHYFTDRLDELKDAVRSYYESGPGAALLADV